MINKIKEATGAVLVLAGIIVCMCEVPDLQAQVTTLCIGAAIVLTGVLTILNIETKEEY